MVINQKGIHLHLLHSQCFPLGEQPSITITYLALVHLHPFDLNPTLDLVTESLGGRPRHRYVLKALQVILLGRQG